MFLLLLSLDGHIFLEFSLLLAVFEGEIPVVLLARRLLAQLALKLGRHLLQFDLPFLLDAFGNLERGRSTVREGLNRSVQRQ